jgi:hypothetical protein
MVKKMNILFCSGYDYVKNAIGEAANILRTRGVEVNVSEFRDGSKPIITNKDIVVADCYSMGWQVMEEFAAWLRTIKLKPRIIVYDGHAEQLEEFDVLGVGSDLHILINAITAEQKEPDLVFVEFISLTYPKGGGKHYFVGVSYEAIMADTEEGKKFGFASFTSHRLITDKEARSLGLRALDEGIAGVRGGFCRSYSLITPK